MAELGIWPVDADILFADTKHMTAEQFGAYVRLLLIMWLQGAKLHNDPGELARIAGVSPKVWKRLAPVVLKPMTVTPEAISQQRLTKTWFHELEYQRKVSRAGHVAARNRWKNKG
jgi:uncharacterized protein YdaU (DUF1376 family)